jgi:hypothetical protein
MANDVTYQSSTLATPPSGTVVATQDLGSGRQIQMVLVGGAGTVTNANVASSASSVTLLSANAARLGATLWNDSNASCFVKMGTTAVATDAVVKMGPGSYYEVPYGYDGRIDGIWDVATGAMRVGEWT